MLKSLSKIDSFELILFTFSDRLEKMRFSSFETV